VRRVDAARTFWINDNCLLRLHRNSKRPRHDRRNGDGQCVGSQAVRIYVGFRALRKPGDGKPRPLSSRMALPEAGNNARRA
jgi:hypothetical protein